MHFHCFTKPLVLVAPSLLFFPLCSAAKVKTAPLTAARERVRKWKWDCDATPIKSTSFLSPAMHSHVNISISPRVRMEIKVNMVHLASYFKRESESEGECKGERGNKKCIKKGEYCKNIHTFKGPIMHNIWWENRRNKSGLNQKIV